MKHKLILSMALIFTLLCGCAQSGAPVPASPGSQYIQMVKGGTNDAFPGKTYGDAFDNFFGSPRWKYFRSDTGDDVVEVSGSCTYRDVKVNANLQFLLNLKDKTFEAGALSLNDVPQVKLITLSLIQAAFDELEKTEPSPAPQKAGKSEKAAVEWLGATTADVIKALGNDYTLDSVQGTQILYFAEQPYSFYFVPTEWGKVVGDETVIIVRVYGEGKVNDTWRNGMTENEIKENTGADELLDRGFYSDETSKEVRFVLKTAKTEFMFQWYEGDTSKPCDVTTVALP